MIWDWDLCRDCRIPQNEQICLPQNADIYKTATEVADLIFAGALDFFKKCM